MDTCVLNYLSLELSHAVLGRMPAGASAAWASQSIRHSAPI